MSLNFPELFIKGKYLKIRFKNRGSPCYFQSSRGQKMSNITKIEPKRLFGYILGFIFYGFFYAKTELNYVYMI